MEFPSDLWVEAKAGDKVYYYNARTRETSWSKPENAKIVCQEQLLRPIGQANFNQDANKKEEAIEKINDLSSLKQSSQIIPNPFISQPLLSSINPTLNSKLTLPGMVQPFAPFGVPGNVALSPAVPTLWNNQLLGNSSNIDAKQQTLLLQVDNEIKLAASEWTEHVTPDGKSYYFSSKTNQSVWEKPKALITLEEAIADIKARQEKAESNLNQLIKNGEVKTDTNIEENKVENNEEKTIDKKPDQPRDKSKPTSSTPVSGTPWCVVWTGDNRVFFFNPSTRTSVWERPIDLKNRSDVDKLIKAPPKSSETLESPNQEKRPIETEPDQVIKKQKKAEEESEKENKKDLSTEAELLAAKQREILPVEERIQMFRLMLIEKEVSAFSTWEKELHKIVFDPRYLLLTSKERKQIFDKYVKERAEEERKEKRQRLKQQRDEFRKLMEDSNLTYRSTFGDFAQKYSKDERFRNIEKMRDRESLFNDYICDLKKKEKEEKAAQKEKTKQGFIELLKEQKYLERHSKWTEVKEKIRSDERYKSLGSSSFREDVFKSYISSIASKTESGIKKETEEDVKDREKQERIEASLREREKEVKRELSTHLRERDKEREQHKHAEAVEHFNALLTDLVRNADVSWREAKKVLKKDHRWDSLDLLEREEREKLFNDHINNLLKKKREKFRELLDETKEIALTSNWRDVRRLIKEDSRYNKFSSSDRKCEREFREYMKDRLSNARSEFRDLLKETKIITYRSKKMIEESEQHLQDIIAVLQNDKRYLVLDCIEDDRRHSLMSYIDELDRKGPPPPPTASEPIRRATK